MIVNMDCNNVVNLESQEQGHLQQLGNYIWKRSC